MGIFSHKTKQIVISIDPVYCIRSIPLDNIAYNATVIVETGCVGIYVVNGRMRPPIFEPGRYLINDKSERGFISSMGLIAANVDKEFEVCSGIGGIPYHDDELGVDAKVGISADMKVRINNPWDFYVALGNRDVTEKDVNDYLRRQCATVLQAELAKRLQYCTYEDISTQAAKMAKKAEEQLQTIFLEKGVELVKGSLVLGNFYFDEDYLEYRKRVQTARGEAAIAKDEQAAKREKDMADLEALSRAKEIFGRKPDAAPADRKCPLCGMTVPAGASVCPNCGKKM